MSTSAQTTGDSRSFVATVAISLMPSAPCSHLGRQVSAMCGDGGFARSLGGILALTQYDFPIKIVVLSNSALGMVKLEMEVNGFPDFQADSKNPNFPKLAEAIGIMGARIENSADISSALKGALQQSGPTCIDMVTDPNAVSLPSHIATEMVVGFGATMGKPVHSGHIDKGVDTIQPNVRRICAHIHPRHPHKRHRHGGERKW